MSRNPLTGWNWFERLETGVFVPSVEGVLATAGVEDGGGEAATGAEEHAAVEAVLTGEADDLGGAEGTAGALEEVEEPGLALIEEGGRGLS